MAMEMFLILLQLNRKPLRYPCPAPPIHRLVMNAVRNLASLMRNLLRKRISIFFNNVAAGDGHMLAAGSELIGAMIPHSNVLTRQAAQTPASDHICPRQRAGVRGQSVDFSSRLTFQKNDFRDRNDVFSDGGDSKRVLRILSSGTSHHPLAGRRVIRIARTAPGIGVTPAQNGTRTHDDKVRIRVPSASDGTLTQKISFFPKFDVGLDNGSSAAFFNYVTAAMCNGHLAPTTFSRDDDPRRGHERPPPAIVCGKNGKNLRQIFWKSFEN